MVQKKSWGLQVDGGVCQRLWQLVRARGAKSIIITKAEGHATDEQVEDGIVEEQDKRDNGKANGAADLGVTYHQDGVRGASTMDHPKTEETH